MTKHDECGDSPVVRREARWVRLRGLLLSVLLVAPVTAASTASAATLMTAQRVEGTVNINAATSEQLQLLPGIGPATAGKILDYRKKQAFKHPSQLMRIKGIGRKTYETIRPYVTVEGDTTLRPAGDAE